MVGIISKELETGSKEYDEFIDDWYKALSKSCGSIDMEEGGKNDGEFSTETFFCPCSKSKITIEQKIKKDITRVRVYLEAL